MLAKDFGYSVRIIESHPDLRNPAINYEDRSSSINMFYRGLHPLSKHGINLHNEKPPVGVAVSFKTLHTK